MIIPGLIGLVLWGLPLAVDFTGGSFAELIFSSGRTPALEDVRTIYAEFGFPDAEARTSGDDGLVIRTKHMDDATNSQIIEAMEARFSDQVEVLRFESVGPSVGREVATRAAGAVALASVAILLYIWYAFRGVAKAYRYGVGAILAMLHDVGVVFGMQAILSHYFGWERWMRYS